MNFELSRYLLTSLNLQMLERLEGELLNPLIGRVFAIMDERGLIPVPPDDLVGKMLEVKYISLLAQTQQMVGINSIDKLTVFTTGLSAVTPEALDKVNFDEAIDQYAKMLGVPASIVRSEREVADARAARAQQAQAQAEMAAAQNMATTAQSGADAVGKMSQAAASGGIDALAGMFGGFEEGEEF